MCFRTVRKGRKTTHYLPHPALTTRLRMGKRRLSRVAADGDSPPEDWDPENEEQAIDSRAAASLLRAKGASGTLAARVRAHGGRVGFAPPPRSR